MICVLIKLVKKIIFYHFIVKIKCVNKDVIIIIIKHSKVVSVVTEW